MPNQLNLTVVSSTEVTAICPTMSSQCTVPASNIQGWLETVTYREYDICSASSCRFGMPWSAQIGINMTAIPNSSVYAEMTESYVDLGLGFCNNSPVFNSKNFMTICDSATFDYDLGATDPDGDSLWYSLDTLEDAGGMPIPYNPGYSMTSPMGPNWTVSLDNATGELHIVPNPGGYERTGILIHVDEYRNGVKIGVIERLVSFMVVNCNGNTSPQIGAISNVVGSGVAFGDTVEVCPSGPICFDIVCSDADTGQNLRFMWDQRIPGATFTETGNPSVQDTILGSSNTPLSGTFCWPTATTGIYQFTLKVEDDNCPYYAYNERIITLVIGQYAPPTVTVTPATCPSANFSLTTCGPGPVTYQWSGAMGMSSTAQSFSYAYPAPGNYGWQVIVQNGSYVDTVMGNVTVGGSPSPATIFSGVNYVSPCTGNLYDTLDAGNWSSYLWSTGDTTQQLPVFIGGNYGVVVTDSIGCTFADTATLYWSEPDVYGVVTTSTGQPLQNQRILLIAADTALQTLTAVDSNWTDSLGYYYFCNVVDSLVFLKATPRIFDYPNEMPTYADTTLFWNNAIPFLTFQNFPLQHDFSTLYGTNPGGPGFIGGFITMGANKMDALGDPVVGLRVFLRNRNTGAILGYRDSYLNGYFSFPGIPLGDYEVVPDRPNVSIFNVPQLTVGASSQTQDSLNFSLHRAYLELVSSVSVTPPTARFSFSAVPNPFGNQTQLLLAMVENGFLEISAFDVMGRELPSLAKGEYRLGNHRFMFGEGLPQGMYFIRLKMGAETNTIAVWKN